MPCYQVRTTQLAVEAANLHIMAQALEALGLQATVDGQTIRVRDRQGVSGYFANGRLTMNGAMPITVQQLKQEYSRQSILTTAKQKGWQVRLQKGNKIEVTRRRIG